MNSWVPTDSRTYTASRLPSCALAVSVRPLPSPARAWIETLGFGRLPIGKRFVIGSILLLRAEALAEVGGFDERYFLYAEETDWQLRARRAGWRIGFAPHVHAMHVGAGTGGDAAVREAHFHASHELFIRKHYGRAGWLAYRCAVLGSATVRSVLPGDERRRIGRRTLHIYLRGPVRTLRHG